MKAYGVQCSFLVARPWAPWPLHKLRRWQNYGPQNRLVGPPDIEVRAVHYVRPPGAWFRRFEAASMGVALDGMARRWHDEHPFDIVLGVPLIPDAEVAVGISEVLSLPLATLAIGSDVMVYPEQTPLLKPRVARVLERATLPVGVSEAICRRLLETGKCQREPLCLYLGRDNEQFKPAPDKAELRRKLGWRPKDVVGIYVGRIADTKGIRELVVASGQLLAKYADFKLVCIGDGPALARLMALRERIDRNGAVVLPGSIAPEEVPAYLQTSDFMVFPSHSEGMPQAVLEAMDCGLPVVASRVGGVPEAVIDGQTGILVEPENAVGLCAAMERMILDEEHRVRAGKRGHALAKEKFDPICNAERFAGALWSLAGRPMPPRRPTSQRP